MAYFVAADNSNFIKFPDINSAEENKLVLVSSPFLINKIFLN